MSPPIRVAVWTSAGSTEEAAGSSKTSSKVSPSPVNLSCRIARLALWAVPIENVPLLARLVDGDAVSVMYPFSSIY
jgi:hypothetical protein